MGSITLTGDGDVQITVLSNLFIDEYMKDANDAQLKVYLYLTRMLQAHAPVSVSDIADRFNHTLKPLQPFAFAADQVVKAKLTAGQMSMDFNITIKASTASAF